jgi:hypothetical protein
MILVKRISVLAYNDIHGNSQPGELRDTATPRWTFWKLALSVRIHRATKSTFFQFSATATSISVRTISPRTFTSVKSVPLQSIPPPTSYRVVALMLALNPVWTLSMQTVATPRLRAFNVEKHSVLSIFTLLANEVYPLNLSVQPSSPEISFMPSYRCSKIAEECIRQGSPCQQLSSFN